MKIQILKENIIDNGAQYTRIKYSNGDFMWYYGFDNNGSSSLDEVGFGSGKTFDRLESNYQELTYTN